MWLKIVSIFAHEIAKNKIKKLINLPNNMSDVLIEISSDDNIICVLNIGSVNIFYKRIANSAYLHKIKGISDCAYELNM